VLEQQQQEEEEAGREEREGESARVGEGHGAVMEPLMSVTEFLEQCKVSGDSAYNAVKVVLERLRNPETRVSARVLLAAVEKHVAQEEEKEKEKERESSGVAADSMTKYHFRIHQLSLTDYEGFRENRQKLTLLELPSIFVPEDWSFTFFEGINRHPDTGFRDRDVAELGCGNGWVSIALAERWSPRKAGRPPL
jgi:methionine S-methyltransferase